MFLVVSSDYDAMLVGWLSKKKRDSHMSGDGEEDDEGESIFLMGLLATCVTAQCVHVCISAKFLLT